MVGRCYNGCPDDELQGLIDDQKAAHAEARERGLILTYFPMEAAWLAAHYLSQIENHLGLSHPTGASLRERLEEMRHDLDDYQNIPDGLRSTHFLQALAFLDLAVLSLRQAARS